MKYEDLNPEGIKVGDIVTGYHVGYWEVTEITQHHMTPDLRRYSPYAKFEVGELYALGVKYKRLLDAEMRPSKKMTNSCDLGYCVKVTPERIDTIEEDFARKIKALRELL